MPTLRLTEAAIQRFKKPQAGQVEYFDSLLPAFGLRFSYGGSRTWFVTCRVAGQSKLVRTTLGRFPAVGLAEARKKARSVIADAERGLDPRQKRLEAQKALERKNDRTFSKVAEEYLNSHVRRKLKPSTVSEYELAFRRAAKWNDWPIESITRSDIRSLLESLDKKGSSVAADSTFSYLRAFFNWCVIEREILEHAPTDRMKRTSHAQKRERFLSHAEISVLWETISEMPYPFGPFLCTLLLTGQRRSEVAGMRWDELEDMKIWTISSERTKNSLSHIVPLSPLVASFLKKCPRLGPYVFTSTGETPISGFSKTKRRLSSLEVLSSFEPWTLHDLRRTMVTQMNENLGVQPHVVEAVVNHVSGSAKAGVAGTYNRALYLDERRIALNAWSNFVNSCAREYAAVEKIDG